MRFAYHVEPVRVVLGITVFLLILAIVIPVGLIRIVILAAAVGPGAWALLQWLRSRCGVCLTQDHLVIDNPFTRRARHIPYAMIRGYIPTSSDGLIAAYVEAPKPAPTTRSGTRVALTDMRPESHRRPKQHLVVTPPIDDLDSLLAALGTQIQKSMSTAEPAIEPLSPDEIRRWARRKRLRDTAILILGVLATPFYVIIVGRIVASFLNILGVSSVR